MQQFIRFAAFCLYLCVFTAPFFIMTASAKLDENFRYGEQDALNAAKSRSTVENIERLYEYRGNAAYAILLDIQANSRSRRVRAAASNVLISYSEYGDDPAMWDAIGTRILDIAKQHSTPREIRKRAMRSLVNEYFSNQTFQPGKEILDIAASYGQNEGIKQQAVSAVMHSISLRPDNINQFLTHKNKAIQVAAAMQVVEWNEMDSRLPYKDIVKITKWKETRIAMVTEEIKRTEQQIKEHPENKDNSNWGFSEAPTKKLARLQKYVYDYKKIPVFNIAVEKYMLYNKAMLEIARGEQRVKQRVVDAYEPRDPFEIIWETTEVQRGPTGMYEEVVVGENSIVIDLDAILGPKQPPTEENLNSLKMPDAAHAKAIAHAQYYVRQLFELSPETVDLVTDKVKSMRNSQPIALPDRP